MVWAARRDSGGFFWGVDRGKKCFQTSFLFKKSISKHFFKKNLVFSNILFCDAFSKIGRTNRIPLWLFGMMY